METRTLGRTGLRVSVLGLGASEIGLASEPVAQDTVTELVRGALDAGLNVIDTAECYGSSEALLGRALEGRRHECHVFTKCGHLAELPLDGTGPRALALRAEDHLRRRYARGSIEFHPEILRRSIERSLGRLRTDHLDGVLLHGCSETVLRRGDAIRVLHDARRAGKVRFVGYAGDGAAARYAVACGAFDLLETSVNVADQEAMALTLADAHARGTGVIAKRAAANAVFTLPASPRKSVRAPAFVLAPLQTYWERLRELDYPFLRGEPTDAVAQALRFTLSVPGVHVALVGTTRPGRYETNARALAALGPLPDSEREAIVARWRSKVRPSWVGQS